jgi:hypothetical protein
MAQSKHHDRADPCPLAECPLMTQSGHRPTDFAVMQNTTAMSSSGGISAWASSPLAWLS